MTSRLTFAIAILAAAFCLGGCEAISHVTTSIWPDAPVDTPQATTYPDAAEIAAPLDIQVVRVDRRHIRFDNRSTEALANVTVFINHEYGGTVESLPIGGSGNIPLIQFVNQHGERFPVGSFLEPEKAKVLLLADAVIDGKIHKMNVRLEKDWDTP